MNALLVRERPPHEWSSFGDYSLKTTFPATPAAKKEFQRATQLDANDPLAHQALGIYLAAQGDLNGALKEMTIARGLDPLSLDIGMKLGLIKFYLRRYGAAMTEYKKVIDLDPHYSVAHFMLGAAYFVQQDFANAAAELKVSSALVNDREPLAFGLYAAACARLGDDTAARYVEAHIRERAQKEYVSPASMAVFYLGLGRLDDAYPWMEQMFRDRLLNALLANVDPLFDPAKADPRMAKLLGTAKSPRPSSVIVRTIPKPDFR